MAEDMKRVEVGFGGGQVMSVRGQRQRPRGAAKRGRAGRGMARPRDRGRLGLPRPRPGGLRSHRGRAAHDRLLRGMTPARPSLAAAPGYARPGT